MKKLTITILGILLIASVSALLMPILVTQNNYEQEQKVTEIPNLLDICNQIINDTYWTQFYSLSKPKPKYRGGGSSPSVEPQQTEEPELIVDLDGDGDFDLDDLTIWGTCEYNTNSTDFGFNEISIICDLDKDGDFDLDDLTIWGSYEI